MSRKRQREDASSEDVFVYYANTELSSIPRDITTLRIDSSVKEIPPRAFSLQTSLVNVEYEEGLVVIGENAFYNCQRLRKQQFPSTLVEIGKHAFERCARLESLGHLPPSLMRIKERAFVECNKLQSIEITNEEICLEEAAFERCSSLTHFRLPQGMMTITDGLFANCTSLADVIVPSTVIKVGTRAFKSCEKLALIELPQGLKAIGDHAFSQTGLQHFHFPATVETIGTWTFRNCFRLESVILPPNLKVIPPCTFLNCSKLEGVSIPHSIVQFGEYAFYGCGLTQVDLSRTSLRRIGTLAFGNCTNLREIILPRTRLKRIEKMSFRDCESLTHLWVPPTVKYIDNGAFAGCTSLLSVEVPETLKRLVFIGYDEEAQVEEPSELCGYESLVNIYVPPSQQLDDVTEYEFMEELKLREAESSYRTLVAKLKRRFNLLPLHRACYFQSYHSLQENITRIRSILQAGPKACERVDFLGMTPFHIIALSRKPWLNLFQELLSVPCVDIVNCRDVFGCTPFDYLCKNHSSSAACVTISLLLTVMEPRISFLGLEWWRDDIMSGLEKVKMAGAESLATEVTAVCQKLALFERMEVLSLLEMSMWRSKVEEEQVTKSDARESCRINCGSSIVLEHVLPFLGTE